MTNPRKEKRELLGKAPTFVPPHSVHLLIAAERMYWGWQEGEGGIAISLGVVTSSPLALGCILCTASALEAFMNQIIYIYSDICQKYDAAPYMESDPLKKFEDYSKFLGNPLLISDDLRLAIWIRNEVAHFIPYTNAASGSVRSGLQALEDKGIIPKLEEKQALLSPRWASPNFLPWFCRTIESAANDFLCILPKDERYAICSDWAHSFNFYAVADEEFKS